VGAQLLSDRHITGPAQYAWYVVTSRRCVRHMTFDYSTRGAIHSGITTYLTALTQLGRILCEDACLKTSHNSKQVLKRIHECR
jgi:hypothetical protein